MPRTNLSHPLLRYGYWFLSVTLGATLAGMLMSVLAKLPMFWVEGHPALFISWCYFELVIWIARWIALYRLQAIDNWRSSIGWPTHAGELLVFAMFSAQLGINDLSKIIDTIGFGLGLAGQFCLFGWAIGRARPGTWWVVGALVYAIGRECQNCHSQVHGSNSPSGPRLQR